MTRVALTTVAVVLVALFSAPARAGDDSSVDVFYLGVGDTLGTTDYGHRLERRHGAGVLLGTRMVLTWPVGPMLLGGGFGADVSGGFFWNSHDDWRGIYVNYRLDAGVTVGLPVAGAPLLLTVGGAMFGDTAMFDDINGGKGWSLRARYLMSKAIVDAGFTWASEIPFAQWMLGVRIPMGGSGGSGPKLHVLIELTDTFGTASQNNGLHTKLAAAIGY